MTEEQLTQGLITAHAQGLAALSLLELLMVQIGRSDPETFKRWADRDAEQAANVLSNSASADGRYDGRTALFREAADIRLKIMNSVFKTLET